MKHCPGILLIMTLLLFSINLKAQNTDIDLLKSINQNETNIKNKYASFLKGGTYVAGIAMPATVFITGLAKKDKQLQRTGLYMAGAYVTSIIVTQGMKRVIDRKRPFEQYPFIVKRVNEDNGLSMPSGHTSSAFCTATSLSLYYPKWYVIVPSYLWACSVGWARMYEGVHYPSDVLVGAIVGASSAWLGHLIQHKMEKRKAKK